jgi:hypothetical protein
MKKVMDHEAYPKALKKKSISSLFYIIQDATDAVTAMPDGVNAGYYLDEINYASMELNSRMPAIRQIDEEDAATLSTLLHKFNQIVDNLKKTYA